jgi:N-acetylglucosamine-6-phosphate deacetylase
MDAALRWAVHSGWEITDAVTMTSTTPAEAIGLGDERGRLVAGLRADLVLLDEELRVVDVVVAGERYPD